MCARAFVITQRDNAKSQSQTSLYPYDLNYYTPLTQQLAFVKMVRSVIPDSDQESGDEAAPYDFSSAARPTAVAAGAPNIPAMTDNHENASTPTIGTQDDVIGQLLLGTGSTGMLYDICTSLNFADENKTLPFSSKYTINIKCPLMQRSLRLWPSQTQNTNLSLCFPSQTQLLELPMETN